MTYHVTLESDRLNFMSYDQAIKSTGIIYFTYYVILLSAKLDK